MSGMSYLNNIRVSLDYQCFLSKPDDDEILRISNRIGSYVKQLNISGLKNFAFDVGRDGYTFSPATFKNGTRNQENFEQQQLFALDIDNVDPSKQVSFMEIKERAEKYDLPILFAYDTFNSKNKERFRIVFLNDISISDGIIAKAMLKALAAIFPEADKLCYMDISKMYFGGKEVLYYNDKVQTINVDTLFRSLCYYLREIYKENHYKEKVAIFCNENGIGLNKNGLPDIIVTNYPTEIPGASRVDENGKKSPNAIIYENLYRIANGEIFRTKYYCVNLVDIGGTNKFSVGKKVLKNHDDYRSHILVDINKCCQLFNDFVEGKIKLNHGELFGLATNLIHVETGLQKFKNTLSRQYHFYGNKYNKWSYDVNYIKQHDYRPQGCDSFCPHYNVCAHGTNILSTVKPKRRMVEKVPDYIEEFYPVKDVEDDVYQAIYDAYNAGDRRWHIVKAMTGAGKTTAYLKLIFENPFDRFLIAAPTNFLKNEIYDKAVKMGIDVRKTPSLEEIKDDIPSNVWKRIQRLYKRGQHRSVHPYINEILKTKNIPCLVVYMKEREELKTFDGSVITTHRYLLSMDEKRISEYNCIIVDEDIIFKSIVSNQDEITISKLKKILNETTNRALSKKIKKLLKLVESKSCIELDSFEYDDYENEDISTPFDIPSFCLAKYFYVRRTSREKNLEKDTITYLKPVTFKNVKYIMVSATVNENICQKYFGEGNVSFHECKKAEYEGILYQYADKSMSRTSIDNDEGIIERLMKRFSTTEDKVITFMKYGIGHLHFGNTEGSNTLEGEDILVIGTPYHAEFLYKLVTFTMGLDFDDNAEMESRFMTNNGYRFWFTTYDDENLRSIHFWMIESELEQAVGRARLLRNNCKVHLFSNYPLSQANVVNKFAYDKG